MHQTKRQNKQKKKYQKLGIIHQGSRVSSSHVGVFAKNKNKSVAVSVVKTGLESFHSSKILYPRRSAQSELRFVVPRLACRAGNRTTTAAAAVGGGGGAVQWHSARGRKKVLADFFSIGGFDRESEQFLDIILRGRGSCMLNIV